MDPSELLSKNANGETVNRTKTTSTNGAIYSLRYKPLAYVIATAKRVQPTVENVNTYKKDYEGLLYFELWLNQENLKGDLLKAITSTPEEYDELIQYCSFGLQNDMQLVINDRDTIFCSGSIYERTYGIKPGITFQTVFERPSQQIGNLTYILNDKILKNGPIKIRFSQDEIEEPLIQ